MIQTDAMKPFIKLAITCLIVFSLSNSLAILHGADKITRLPFGKTLEGQVITLYVLTNDKGSSVGIMDYGATIVKLLVPDREGKLDDIALGFESAEPYFTKSPYFGATIGRYANRIAKGTYYLDGQTYHLATNNNGNSLHGGNIGFDKCMWKVGQTMTNPPMICFTRISPDGEEGYPGKLNVAVTFTLSENNKLRISYRATTDKRTVLNLTNHTYFNLGGAGNGTILGQLLTIRAKAFTPVDSLLIPTGKIQPVVGTPWDFVRGKAIGTDIKATGGNPVGYDHNYVLDKDAPYAAQVYDPANGRLMTVTTDQPGLQFYSGNFLDGTIKGKGDKIYPQYSAFCLETQHFPDSPNHANFPSTILNPGYVYETTTTYSFETR